MAVHRELLAVSVSRFILCLYILRLTNAVEDSWTEEVAPSRHDVVDSTDKWGTSYPTEPGVDDDPVASKSFSCPDTCECNNLDNTQTVQCSGQHIDSVEQLRLSNYTKHL